jgi:hypothetical protein
MTTWLLCNNLAVCVTKWQVVSGSALSDATVTRTITIVFDIIGAALMLVTVVVTCLQYRLQRRGTQPNA